eukprot:TRINITY_DN1555_c0_g1_i1.p1 TRINITY_DN1555_c0_g1~~TRINITY_DN1555_c0_g1_i1.p1  ORF type:complete len:345 (-),score=64.01 TRINITY_DN1555_c0_g1_i1:176-1210(-)
MQFLSSIPVLSEKLPHPDHVHTVRQHSSVADALKLMSEKNISSVPITREDNSLVGLLDYSDLTTLIVNSFYDLAGVSKTGGGDIETRLTALRAATFSDIKVVQDSNIIEPAPLKHLRETFSQTSVDKIMNLSGRNMCFPVDTDATLADVIKQFTSHTTARRIPVVDKGTNQIRSLITQSTLVKFFTQEIAEFAVTAAKPLIQVHPKVKVFHKVVSSLRTIDVFALMNEHKLSSVPLYEHDDPDDPTSPIEFISNLSTKDIWPCLSNFGLLLLPADEFISYVRQHTITSKEMSPLIKVKADITVGELLKRLCAARIHRIYITNQHELVGVCSLTDIIRIFIEHSP